MIPQEKRFGSILLSNGCSNNCVFCRCKSKDSPSDLSLSDEARLRDDTLYFINNGFEEIDISGAEPLRYSKIIEYLKWIRPKFKRITILDPGNRLSDPLFARGLAEVGVDNLVIPIYGSDAAHHDSAVGRTGAFEEVTRGIKNYMMFKQEKSSIELTSMFLRQNILDISRLIDFCIENLKIPISKISLPNLHYEYQDVKSEEFQVTFEEVRKVILRINSMSNILIAYVPPCIFSGEELVAMEKMTFFNVYYLYNLSSSERNKKVRKWVYKYRSQTHMDCCKTCHLSKEMCGGIMREYLATSGGFKFNPISEDIYDIIKDRILFEKINPGAEKQYDNIRV